MPMHLGAADSLLITSVRGPINADATVTNSNAIDMSGWMGVSFVIPIGVLGTNGTVDALVQRDDNSGFNSPTNINGAALTQITNANGLAIIDVWRPSERYVRLQTKGQTNGALIAATAIRYRGSVLPPTQTAVQYVKVAEN